MAKIKPTQANIPERFLKKLTVPEEYLLGFRLPSHSTTQRIIIIKATTIQANRIQVPIDITATGRKLTNRCHAQIGVPRSIISKKTPMIARGTPVKTDRRKRLLLAPPLYLLARKATK